MTPTGFLVFNDINDLANFVPLLFPIIYHYVRKKWHNLFPEIPFIDAPGPPLPDKGDRDIYEGDEGDSNGLRVRWQWTGSRGAQRPAWSQPGKNESHPDIDSHLEVNETSRLL